MPKIIITVEDEDVVSFLLALTEKHLPFAVEFLTPAPQKVREPKRKLVSETRTGKIVLDFLKEEGVSNFAAIGTALAKHGYNPRSAGAACSRLFQEGAIDRVKDGGSFLYSLRGAAS